MKEIKITCSGAERVPLESLINFQGKLKKLEDQEYQNLRQSIEKNGFSFPVFVWKNEGKNFIIDGHQRVEAVNRMIKDGFSINENLIPVDWIEAKNKKEAKIKVLLAMSQYGKYSQDSLYEYISAENLNFTELKEMIDLPQIDIKKFEFDYFEEKEISFLDKDAMINKFSVMIKCANETEMKNAMKILRIKKAKVYYEDFIRSRENKK